MIENKELYALAHDFGKMPGKYVKKVKPIFNKTALEIKKGMADDLKASSSFKHAAKTVDYDLHSGTFGGALGLSAEIGPNATRGEAAALAGLAYFGGSHGGGGTVRDPIFHARDQETKMVGFLAMAAEGLL